MSYFEEDGSTYDNQIRKIKEDDLATALLLNTLVQSLVNNDAFIKSIIEKHLANRENPHNVSKKQLMLENVDNTSDLNKPVSLAVQDAFDTYYEQLAGYTDQAIGDLINGAPETLNTLKEVADAIAEHKSVQEALNAAIGKKANAEEFDSHTKAMATSTVPGHVKVDTALSSTSTNAVQNKVINAALDKKLDKTGDSKDNTVTFTSNDALNPTAYTDVNALASGEKHSSILNKISTMFKNIRYLYKLLGNHTIESNVPPNAKFTDNNTWNAFEGATSTVAGTAGYVPAPTAGDATRYFRSDGTWAVPPNQTYQNFIKSGTGAKAGLVPEPPTTAGTGKYLREDGTWATPPDNDTKTTVENVLTSTNTKNALSAAQGKVLQGEIDDINSNLQIIKSGTAVVSGVFSDYFRFINIHFDKPFNEVPIVVLTLVGNTALIIERAEVFGITEDQFTVFVTYQDGAAKDTTRPNREVKWIAIGK